ncbi:site-specific DNA-methyltransferase [Synechocystis salina LEGE 06155]|nr:site-specific DNA-methyltransferase [Synechocystis salina LEGE 06155]
MKLKQEENSGKYYAGDSKEILQLDEFKKQAGKVKLILTSPPFPLNQKKSYGNTTGKEYLEWFASLAPIFAGVLSENGSIIIEMGNGWEPNRPVQSLLPLKALIEFIEHENAGLRLVQKFVCYNPSRLPSPAQWVTVNRIRTVDSYTNIWWISNSDFPIADNSKVLRPYSKSMLKLLEKGKFNSGIRPSGHHISQNAFLKECGGSIAHNFFEIEPLDANREVRLPYPVNAFSFSNTSSNDFFLRACKERGITKPHPARMPMGLAAFFIEFLTDPNDLILDPFAGSNTTGYAAARLRRRWIAIDSKEEYVKQSKIRFEDPLLHT